PEPVTGSAEHAPATPSVSAEPAPPTAGQPAASTEAVPLVAEPPVSPEVVTTPTMAATSTQSSLSAEQAATNDVRSALCALRSALPEAPADLAYVIVNEAGASVYSASAIGREEFPNFDATLRGTISIGRRLQDPLSELVKIDPQNIGVGLYQHDVHPRYL